MTHLVDITEKAAKLRIYVGEGNRHGHDALYSAIVRVLRERGIWGATVFRAMMGYGKKNAIHQARVFTLSQDLPMIIEAIDREEKINAVLPEIASMVKDGLITLEDVTIVTKMTQEERA